MNTLRSRIIRLASENPELRSHLLPILKEAAVDRFLRQEIADAAISLASTRWMLRGHQDQDPEPHVIRLTINGGRAMPRSPHPEAALDALEKQGEEIEEQMGKMLSRWKPHIQWISAVPSDRTDWDIEIRLR